MKNLTMLLADDAVLVDHFELILSSFLASLFVHKNELQQSQKKQKKEENERQTFRKSSFLTT